MDRSKVERNGYYHIPDGENPLDFRPLVLSSRRNRLPRFNLRVRSDVLLGAGLGLIVGLATAIGASWYYNNLPDVDFLSSLDVSDSRISMASSHTLDAYPIDDLAKQYNLRDINPMASKR